MKQIKYINVENCGWVAVREVPDDYDEDADNDNTYTYDIYLEEQPKRQRYKLPAGLIENNEKVWKLYHLGDETYVTLSYVGRRKQYTLHEIEQAIYFDKNLKKEDLKVIGLQLLEHLYKFLKEQPDGN
jgi:hypothetical protein